MFSLRVAILFPIVFAVVSSDYLSDGVKTFKFLRAKDDSSEYDFE